MTDKFERWVQVGILLVTLLGVYFDQRARSESFQRNVVERIAKIEARLDAEDSTRAAEILRRLNDLRADPPAR